MIAATMMIVLILSITTLVSGLHIKSIQVPKYAKVGDNIKLLCDYEEGVDQVYSVKWYKDNMEFYRYVPKDRPRAQRFDVDGVRVGLDSSSHNTVELINISLDTAGTLMCEVSLEAPRFKTVEASSDLTVVLPPHSAPVISPGPAPGHRYRVGDSLEINCTSPGSSPPAKLRYYINNQMDDGSHTVTHRHTDTQGRISPTLTLQLRLTRNHFQGAGVVRVRCEAIIYSVWRQDSEAIYPGQELGEKALERILRGDSSMNLAQYHIFLSTLTFLIVIH